jgi:transcriptional regulator GlxA family with amidase domain
MASARQRHIVVVAFPDVQVLDVMGPLEVFGRAARWLVEEGHRSDLAYSVEVVAPAKGPLQTSSGLKIVADRRFLDLRGPVDTLLVAGGRGSRAAAQNATLRSWLKRTAPRVRRFGSVCTGTFILAAAGLLDGKRATTHWAWCDELARLHPRVNVDADPILVKDGHLYTSAGVTAGMDLALALVEEDFGRQVALAVARQLVLFLRRPGGQSQFSSQLAVQIADREPMRELQEWIADHLGADLYSGARRPGGDEPASFRARLRCAARHDAGTVRRSSARRRRAAPARGVERRRGHRRRHVRLQRRGSDASRVSPGRPRVAHGLPEPVSIIAAEKRSLR